MDHDRIQADYEQNGFVRVPGLLAPRIESIRSELDRYVREVASGVPSGDRVFEADGKSVRNLWRMEQHDAFFAELARLPEITRLVARLVHGEPVLMAVESFCKPARVGSAVPYHQDNAYFCLRPPDALTVWVALDAATEANGAVRYVPGSHKGGLLPHRASMVAGNSYGLAEPPPPGTPEVCATLEPGDVVIHHGETIHRSTPNTTDRSRRGLLLVYRGAHAQVDPKLQSDYDAARAALAVK